MFVLFGIIILMVRDPTLDAPRQDDAKLRRKIRKQRRAAAQAARVGAN